MFNKGAAVLKQAGFRRPWLMPWQNRNRKHLPARMDDRHYMPVRKTGMPFYFFKKYRWLLPRPLSKPFC